MSKLVNLAIAGLVLSVSCVSAFANTPSTQTNQAPQNGAMQADAQEVNKACADEAKTAGCGDKQVGTGLIKCIHAYKEAHHDWKVSEGCHAAMKKMHGDMPKTN